MIVFDLVLATRRRALTGIERYGINLFRSMARSRDDVIAYVSDKRLVGEGLPVVEVSSPLRGWLTLPFRIQKLGGEESHTLIAPSFPPSPFIAFSNLRVARIIHDAFPWTRTDSFSVQGRAMFLHLESILLNRYNYLFCPTDIAANDLRSVIDRKDVKVCGNAPGIVFEEISDEVVERLRNVNFCLAIGTVEPRKNYEKLVEIFTSTSVGMPIVIAGRPGWGESRSVVEKACIAHPDRVVWLNDATDGQLKWLYQNCSVFISASHAEGFNMPLVEAGIFGRKIVCSDLDIHRVVAPGWARILDFKKESKALAKEIAESESVSSAALKDYRQRYSWEKVAENVLELVHG